MRIAFITNAAGGNSGSEKLWIRVADLLSKQGHHIGITMSSGQEIQDQTLLKLIEASSTDFQLRSTIEIPPLRERLLRRMGLRKPFIPYEATLKWLNSFHADLAVINQGANVDGRIWMTMCRSLEIPYCTISQAASESIWPGDDQVDELLEGFEHASANWFVSHKNAELTGKILGHPVPHSHVVGNTFQISNIDFVWPEQDDVLCMACVGRLHPSSKGQDLLIEAFRDQRWQSRKFRLTLYGEGSNARALERYVKSANLEKWIHFAGHQPVEEIWKQEHVLVLPSRYEGKPLAIIEAMLAGRPVVTTDVAGNAEDVVEGVNGFVAPFPTVTAVSEALERLWNARSRLREMGSQAYSMIREKMTVDPSHTLADWICDFAKSSREERRV